MSARNPLYDQTAYPLVWDDKAPDISKGLTKLEAFTMAAMQGLLADPKNTCSKELIAEYATQSAKAALDALAKEQKSWKP